MHDLLPKSALRSPSEKPAPFPGHREDSPYFTPSIFRKASCACGGGCPSCQAKTADLSVSQPGDAAELEADHMADRVMRMPVDAAAPPLTNTQGAPGGIFRKCSACEDEETIQRKAGGSREQARAGNLSSLIGNATASGGMPLDRSARKFFEPRFGRDFGSVRIHTDGQAGVSARALDAQAYTRGTDIVFGTGKYTPGTREGDRLLAHELAHVVQYTAGAVSRKTISREITGGEIAVTKSCDGKAPPATGTEAKNASALDLKTSKNGDPCACLLVMHNKERNARKTAELMHENCSYNLATVEPDTGSRCIKLPSHGSKEEFDPNEFFDPGIVRQCIDDESACQSYLKDKASSTDRAEIDRFVQIGYFLKVKECSRSFSLPVIALHNNAINDTTDYRADKKPKTEFKLDIEKESKDKDTDKAKLQPLKDALVKRFSPAVKNLLTETAGKTNIFRWCASEELSACHIGDPDRPDHVTWVTNRDDFDKLKAKDINVALQDDPARLKPESMTDLSTLFLTLKTIMGGKLGPELTKAQNEALAAGTAVQNKLIEKVVAQMLGGGVFTMMAIEVALTILESDFTAKKGAVAAVQKEVDKYNNLHFLNIEGPGYGLGELTDAGRTESYDIIVSNLKALGLHCCGKNEAEAETKIREGLTLTPPKKTK